MTTSATATKQSANLTPQKAAIFILFAGLYGVALWKTFSHAFDLSKTATTMNDDLQEFCESNYGSNSSVVCINNVPMFAAADQLYKVFGPSCFPDNNDTDFWLEIFNEECAPIIDIEKKSNLFVLLGAMVMILGAIATLALTYLSNASLEKLQSSAGNASANNPSLNMWKSLLGNKNDADDLTEVVVTAANEQGTEAERRSLLQK